PFLNRVKPLDESRMAPEYRLDRTAAKELLHATGQGPAIDSEGGADGIQSQVNVLVGMRITDYERGCDHAAGHQLLKPQGAHRLARLAVRALGEIKQIAVATRESHVSGHPEIRR